MTEDTLGIAIVGFVILMLIIDPVLSLFRKPRYQRFYRRIKKGGITSLRKITWQEFELLCGTYFQNQGYKVKVFGQGGADGGIDLVLTKRRQKSLVQCKHWKSRVGVTTVREMFGVMHAQKYQSVYIVATSGFTREAQAWAKGKPITLLDGKDLLK